MKINEIKKLVKEIEDIGNSDPEDAHAREDELYHRFVAYIAKGGKVELREKARLILSTEEISFPRWYA